MARSRVPGSLAERDRQPGDGQARQRGEQQQPPLHVRADEQGQPLDPEATTAAASPMASAQPSWATSRRAAGARFGTVRENVPYPVHAFRPRKISDPSPAPSRPGISAMVAMGSPSPEASSSKTAPVSGFPSSVLTPAKLPAAAMIA